jgi:hypothetical protein
MIPGCCKRPTRSISLDPSSEYGGAEHAAHPADARLEIQGGLTLEALQARHKKHHGLLDGMTPELTGTAVDGAPEGTADGTAR